jgi:hypothetical protein
MNGEKRLKCPLITWQVYLVNAAYHATLKDAQTIIIELKIAHIPPTLGVTTLVLRISECASMSQIDAVMAVEGILVLGPGTPDRWGRQPAMMLGFTTGYYFITLCTKT